MAGDLKPQVFIQNSQPVNATPGDFWFDTSAGTTLNFRAPTGWVAIDIPTAALDTLSTAVSVLSNAVSVISQAQSVLSVQVVSVITLHNALSTAVSAISVKVDALSTTVSALSLTVSAISTRLDTVSTQVSAISVKVDALSTTVSALSLTVSALSTRVDVISTQVSALSVRHDVTSQAVSIISAGLGGMQMRWVSAAQGVSSTAAAGIAISGLSVSVATGGIYQIDGRLLIQMSVVDALGFSFTFPAMVSSGCAGIMRGAAGLAGGGGLGQSMSVTTGAWDEGGSNSIVLSLIMSTISSTMIDVQWMAQVSTAGTIQMNARVSATTKPVNIQAGSFLRAHRIV